MDPYLRLGVGRDCTREEADEAFHVKASSILRERGPTDPDFVQLGSAYEQILIALNRRPRARPGGPRPIDRVANPRDPIREVSREVPKALEVGEGITQSSTLAIDRADDNASFLHIQGYPERHDQEPEKLVSRSVTAGMVFLIALIIWLVAVCVYLIKMFSVSPEPIPKWLSVAPVAFIVTGIALLAAAFRWLRFSDRAQAELRRRTESEPPQRQISLSDEV
jgi:hypothetical protein